MPQQAISLFNYPHQTLLTYHPPPFSYLTPTYTHMGSLQEERQYQYFRFTLWTSFGYFTIISIPTKNNANKTTRSHHLSSCIITD